MVDTKDIFKREEQMMSRISDEQLIDMADRHVIGGNYSKLILDLQDSLVQLFDILSYDADSSGTLRVSAEAGGGLDGHAKLRLQVRD